ncbi:MAG: hypothetical protein Q4D98_11080 [Planctomycetia bacterium]|nr:hypothetical protein [Planctomycetia bacterium]
MSILVFAEEAGAEKHRFSMTCKVDCVQNLFSTEEGRNEAIEWFRRHRIEKLYLESYRHGVSVDSSVLEEAKKAFEAAGLEVGGCITPTQMSRRKSTQWGVVTCFTDPEGLRFLKETVERTARIFDTIILDDFLFHACTCEGCDAIRAGRSWEVFRREYMLEVSRKWILEPARAVNPKCQIIIKYPCWYEGYPQRGYDVVRQTALFGIGWAGTETREEGPPTQASWLQGWLNDVDEGVCGGCWYDPLGTRPETFVEQARQSILGGTRESLLHCYDYLATTDPGIAIHRGDEGVKFGRADAEAFRQEAELLQKLADFLAGMEPYGVLVPKKPNETPTQNLRYPGYVGMLGIPALPSMKLKETPSFYLTLHALHYENLENYLEQAMAEKRPFAVTYNLFRELPATVQQKILGNGSLPEKMGEKTACVPLEGGRMVVYSRNYKELMDLPPETLHTLRNTLLRPLGFSLEAPGSVSLHLFRAEDGNAEVLENFRNEPVTVTLTCHDVQPRQIVLALPRNDCAEILSHERNAWKIRLQPRSMVLLSTYPILRDSTRQGGSR